MSEAEVWVIRPGYEAAFRLAESGELEETVVWRGPDPNWDEAGYCDEVLGENPALQRAVRAALHVLTREVT